MKRDIVTLNRLRAILGFLLLSGAAFGQSVCNSAAVGPQPFSLVPGGNGAPTYIPGGANEFLGYIPQPYVAMSGEPAQALAFCGPAWQANHTYAVGNMIQLMNGTVLQAIQCLGNCQSGATEPAEFSGSLFWPSPAALWVSTCSDSGSTATCNTVGTVGESEPVNVGEPYQGANVGATMVIINYGPAPRFTGEWTVTASTGSKPFSFSFAGSGLGSGDCTSLVGGPSECVSYQHGSRIVDNEVTWQDVGPQNETLLTPLVDVSPATQSISEQQSLDVTAPVGGGRGNATPTGTVTLTSGNYNSAPASLTSGTATITIPAGALALGADTLTAKYSGDANYTIADGFNSVTVTQGGGPGFNVSGKNVTVNAGATSGNTSTITLTPFGGFTGSVTLTATVSPAPSQDPPTFSFGTTSPVHISGAASGTATLTISTTAATSGAVRYPGRTGRGWPVGGGVGIAVFAAVFFGIGKGGIGKRRRSWRARSLILGSALSLIACLMACGGSGNGGGGGTGTPPGTYTVTVTGTSGNTTASGTLTLIVQ